MGAQGRWSRQRLPGGGGLPGPLPGCEASRCRAVRASWGSQGSGPPSRRRQKSGRGRACSGRGGPGAGRCCPEHGIKGFNFKAQSFRNCSVQRRPCVNTRAALSAEGMNEDYVIPATSTLMRANAVSHSYERARASAIPLSFCKGRDWQHCQHMPEWSWVWA